MSMKALLSRWSPRALLGAAGLTLCVATHAEPASIASYALENGQSGSQTYYDDTYGGPNASGNPNVAGAFLSGGLGQLTDGLLASQLDIFDDRWIGWFSIQPHLTFDLGTTRAVNTLAIHFSNWSPPFNDVGVAGKVIRSYSTDGNLFTFLDPNATPTPSSAHYSSSDADRNGDDARWVMFPYAVDARNLRIQLFDGSKTGGTAPGAKPWIFIGEAAIDVAPVPLPAASWLLLSALGGLMVRRRA